MYINEYCRFDLGNLIKRKDKDEELKVVKVTVSKTGHIERRVVEYLCSYREYFVYLSPPLEPDYILRYIWVKEEGVIGCG